MGINKKPKPWNTDMTDVPADEMVYDDFTNDKFTDLCMLKFKTTAQRLPFWQQAHKDHFADAEWENEPAAQTDLMKAQVDGKTLTMKFCHSTCIVTAQGAFMGVWRWYHLPDIKKVVDNLESGTRALQDDSISFDNSQLNAMEPTGTPVTPISNNDTICPRIERAAPAEAAVRNATLDRIRSAENRDSIQWSLRNQSNEKLGPVHWPHSTGDIRFVGPDSTQPMSSIPVLSQSLFPPESNEVMSPTRVNRTAPLIASTPISQRQETMRTLAHADDYSPVIASSHLMSSPILERNHAHADTDVSATATPPGTSDSDNTQEKHLKHAATSTDPPATANPPTSDTCTDTLPASHIERLEDKLNTLTTIITDYAEERSRCEKIYTDEIRRLSSQIEYLREAKESHPPSVGNTAASNASNHASDKEHLLIGSSLVKLVDESQLKRTKVLCKRGAHPSRMTRIFKAKAKAGERYQSVTLLVGGNRLNRADPASNVASTADEIMTAAECARAISDEVRIVELPPRLTSDSMTSAIVDLNSEVEQKCTDKGFEFVPTRGSFWLGNGCPNRGLIDRKDKIHLTDVGTEMLLECMGMELINPEDPRRGVMPEQPRPSPSQSSRKQASPPPERDHKTPDGRKKPHSPKKPQQNGPRKQPQTKRDNFTPPMGGHTRFYSHSGGDNRNFDGPNHARTQERNQYGQNGNQAEWKQQRKNKNQHRRTAAPTDGPTQGRSLTNAQGNHAWSPHGNYATTSMPKPNAPGYQTRGRDAPNNNSTQERNSQCQLCANYGHSAASCRSRDQYCYTCGQIGHFSRVCPQ